MIKKDNWWKKYKAYIESKEWEDKKQEFKEWCKKKGIPFVCIGCGATTVQVHHRSYARVTQEDMGDLIPLCKPCHDGVHKAHKNGIALVRTDLALCEVHGWDEATGVKKLAPFGKVKNGKAIKKDAVKPKVKAEPVKKSAPARKFPISITKNHKQIRSMIKEGYTLPQISTILKVGLVKLKLYVKQWG